MKQLDINTKYANSLSTTNHFITEYKWEIINFPLVLSHDVIGTTQLSIFGISYIITSLWYLMVLYRFQYSLHLPNRLMIKLTHCGRVTHIC